MSVVYGSGGEQTSVVCGSGGKGANGVCGSGGEQTSEGVEPHRGRGARGQTATRDHDE